MKRHEYLVTSEAHRPSGRAVLDGCTVRQPTVDDRLELASLMMDAYVGTIDYEGEALDQAVEEVDGYLAGEAYIEVSTVATVDGSIQSAVLASRIVGVPMIGYVMTRAAMKGRGLASALLDRTVAAVWDAGHNEIRAFITEGNGPSELIFTCVGFSVIATYGEE